MKLTASTLPFSSILGTGILIQNETGEAVAQFSMLNASTGRTPEEMVAFATRIAEAINAGQPERQVFHPGRGSTYDIVASAALFQVSSLNQWREKSRTISDGDEVTVYRNEHGTFVRFPDEMVSPRFEEVTQS